MKKFRDLALFLLISLSISIIIICFTFNYNLMPVSNNKELKVVIIDEKKDINSVIKILDSKNLIRNPRVFKFYLNISHIKEFNKGEFKLSESMGAKEVINILTR